MVADTRARGHDARVLDARTDLGTLGERFDGVHLAFVIETMDGDEGIAALRACAALLAPDGLLVVRTLNRRNDACVTARSGSSRGRSGRGRSRRCTSR